MISEATAKRIADALERLTAAVESAHFERIINGQRVDAVLPPCSGCGGVGGFHSRTCPHALSDHPRF